MNCLVAEFVTVVFVPLTGRMSRAMSFMVEPPGYITFTAELSHSFAADLPTNCWITASLD